MSKGGLDSRIYRGREVSWDDPAKWDRSKSAAFCYGIVSNSFYILEPLLAPKETNATRNGQKVYAVEFGDGVNIYLYKKGLIEFLLPCPHVQFADDMEDLKNVDLYSFFHSSILNFISSALGVMLITSEYQLSSRSMITRNEIFKARNIEYSDLAKIFNLKERVEPAISGKQLKIFKDVFQILLDSEDDNTLFILSTAFSAASRHREHEVQAAFQQLWSCIEASVKVVAQRNSIAPTHVADQVKFLVERAGVLEQKDHDDIVALRSIRNEIFHEYKVTHQVNTQDVWKAQFLLSRLMKVRFGVDLRIASSAVVEHFGTAKLSP